jgi:hypothetical protein
VGAYLRSQCFACAESTTVQNAFRMSALSANALIFVWGNQI